MSSRTYIALAIGAMLVSGIIGISIPLTSHAAAMLPPDEDVRVVNTTTDPVALGTRGTSVVTISVEQPNVYEDGSKNLIFTINRTNPDYPCSFDFSITGTATPGIDFSGLPSSGALALFPGEVTKSIVIDPRADIYVEPNESVIITLSGGILCTVGSQNIARGRILNDDLVLP